MQQILFLILTVLSHIGASLFFAKPRFNKIITVAIWLVYGVVFLVLPPEMPCLCIDRVRLTEDSFLDVGAPVGPALPVVVKTLILQQ